MKTIYVSGNLLVSEDNLPLRLMKKLEEKFPHIEFKELEPTDNFPEEKNLVIIDTVLGIEKVEMINDIDKIITGKVYSLHDFDLGFNLKLMKKTGKLENVFIIGVPPSMNDEEALYQISEKIKLLF